MSEPQGRAAAPSGAKAGGPRLTAHGIPMFWPLAGAFGLAEAELDLYSKNLRFVEEAEKIDFDLRPKLATKNQVWLALRTMLLRDYSPPNARGVPTTVDGPYVFRQHTYRAKTVGGRDYENMYGFLFHFGSDGSTNPSATSTRQSRSTTDRARTTATSRRRSPTGRRGTCSACTGSCGATRTRALPSPTGAASAAAPVS